MFKLDLEKAKDPEIKLPTSDGSLKSKRVPEKHLFLFYWLFQNLWLCGSFKLWKILPEMGIPDHLTCLLRNLYAGQEATVRLDIEQQTGSKLEKEYVKAVYFHPAYLTSMQSTSWEMPGWMKHKLESRFPGELSITSDMQMIPPLWQKAEKNWRSSWWKWKRRMKSWLKAQHSEN